tara:strand:+ start:6849 stop:7376 length:528 start_codon:yes stop_codon:yes gene_type:complete
MLIQGGTCTLAIHDLRKQLDALELPPDVFVGCPRGKDGEIDATCVGGICTDKYAELDANVEFTFTLNAVDPTFTKPWMETDIDAFNEVCDKVKKLHEEGKVVVVTCVGGANRSRAIVYAIDPSQPPPKCLALQRVAEEYRKEARNNLAPLAPPREMRKRKGDEAKPKDADAPLIN